jgi:hypothetical protein
MKVKIKKVPYIEMIGDWMRVTYKEETVMEENTFKRVLMTLKKTSSLLYLFVISFQIVLMILINTKLLIGTGCFFIGTSFICLLEIFMFEFKK